MNTFLHWLTSPEWAQTVKALLHTLWQGTLVAVTLGILLRRTVDPVRRYRCSLGALAAVLLAGLLTWAWLNRPDASPKISVANPPASAPAKPATDEPSPAVVVAVVREEVRPPAANWTAWLALVWLGGAALMLGRAGWQVAGAERLRRATRPLEDSRVAQLLTEAQRAVRLTRRVRVAVTDKLTSPAVVGVLVPTLILPLSLVTTLTHEQLRFVLLHELAHIRRGDYFANLFQLFAEALLFFNPAAWWISHQVRREREACCDALAIELSGAPADYARTLVHVAENILSPLPVAAPAFGDGREPSSLADRVQRLLVPGYRPSLRLTWRAMLVALLVGGTLLFLSAIGTRLTVAAILSPQQRMEKIEKKMTEYGEPPVAESDSYHDSANAPKAEISGRVRMADGSPLPKIKWINFYHERKHSTGASSGRLDSKGVFSTTVPLGRFYAGLDVPGFAPVLTRLVDVTSTNRIENVDLVLTPGFDTAVEITDAATGGPIADAAVKAQFWVRGMGMGIGQGTQLKTDSAGTAKLVLCSDSVALTLVVNAPGYEITEQRFEQLHPQETLRLRLQRGLSVSGVVLNRADNVPLAGATVRVINEVDGGRQSRYEWTDETRVLATTDAAGRFTVNQLRANMRYWLGVSAPGHESVILKPVIAGAGKLTVTLGPELIVRGRVSGNLEQLQQIDKDRCLSRNYSEVLDTSSNGFQEWVRLQVTNGVGFFQFTNRTAGPVTLSGYGYREEREVSAPVDDWVVDLRPVQSADAKVLPKREVVFRFKHPPGVPPRGTVSVMIPDSLDKNNLTAHNAELQITNSEVRAEIAIGGRTSIEPKRMVGYWFNRAGNWASPTGEHGNWLSIEMVSGPGPLVIEIPLSPAGAIYAKARNADSTAAGGLFFGVSELKRAPGRDQNSLDSGGDSISGDAPRKWVSGPLPLGGTYQISGWRGNSFCLSQPIKLTEANPDAEVELQFPPGKTFNGVVLDADGQPVRGAELEASFSLPDNHGFGLKPVLTDGQGAFRLENTTPGVGEYFVQANAPGMMAERVKLDFDSQPQTIRLKRGRTLGGRVVEAATGYPIPGMEIRALDYERNTLPMLKTQTDADGRFEFTTLGDVNYTLYPDGGELLGRPKSGNQKFRADGSTNLTLSVKLYGWSKLKPKPPTEK